MTDTPKFRAYHIAEKKYYEIVAIDFYLNKVCLIFTNDNVWYIEKWRPIHHIILEQYTGLKDINGVEIFEGDILRFKIDMSELGLGIQTNLIEVKELETIAHIFTVLSNGAELEVIGNIHENSDMLKGDK